MKFWADLHLHTDYDPKRDKWHGEHPDAMAAGIVDSQLDAYAITEHNRMETRFFDVQAEVDRLLSKTKRKVLGLLGVELSVTFQKRLYHACYIYEGTFNRQNLPEIPPPNTPIEDLEEDLIVDHPGVLILAHPSWKDDRKDRNESLTRELMEAEIVDGIELLNGSMLYNGANIEITRRAIRSFLAASKKGAKLSAIGSSDAHEKDLAGKALTEYYAESPEGLFDAIKTHQTRAYSRESSSNAKVTQLCKEFPEIKQYVGYKKH